ncbi:MAG: mechanosensitive ion channel, partial [Pseudomonadota bacterium]|nr:mechanosensitive ion channel [Pseudomonadota bacterium]
KKINLEFNKQKQHLKDQKAALTTLVQSPVAPEHTQAREQQIAALENYIRLQKQILGLIEQYLTTMNTRVELAQTRLHYATQWYEQLQHVFRRTPLEEQQHIIQEAQQTLKTQQQLLKQKQTQLPKKIVQLETQPTIELVNLLEKATLEKQNTEIELENLALELQSAQANLERQLKNLKEQQNSLEILQKTLEPQSNVQRQRVIELEHDVQLQKELITLERQKITLLQEQMELTRQRLALETAWHTALQHSYQARKKQDLETQIQARKAPYLARVAELRKHLEALDDADAGYQLEAQISDAEERAQQVVYELKLAHLQEQLKQLPKSIDEKSIKFYKNVQVSIEEFNSLQSLLAEKIAVLTQRQAMIQKRAANLRGEARDANQQANEIFETLIYDLQQDFQKGKQVLAQLEQAYRLFQHQLLLSRRQWPQDANEWKHLLSEIIAIPQIFLQQLKVTGTDVIQALQQTRSQHWFFLALASFIWLGFFLFVRARLNHLYTTLTAVVVRSFVVNSFTILLRLLHQNAPYIWVSGILLLLIAFLPLTSASMIILLVLILAIVSVKLLINLTWLLLADKQFKAQNRSKLYQQLRLTLILTAVFTVMITLVHIEFEGYPSGLSLNARYFFDSVLMLFLSLAILPVMRIRHLILTFLANHTQLKNYWLWMIRLVTLLLPLALLAVTVLGLIGYINLGWRVAEHVSLFLLVLTGGLTAQGLLNDMITFSKNFALKHSHYGLLWTQDIIPLIHKLLTIALMVLAMMSFLWINGWYADTVVQDIAIKESLEQFLTYPLLTLGNSEIGLNDLLLLIISLWIIFWFGGWCRQVTYRWIYLSIVDLGVRNSFSVFTQYAVILVGLLITLRIMGIDLTTLTVFAGALGVGIGFGLQNIANNFISGLLLLIERPLRTGDIVNIGGSYEGTVKEIGIRSLTLQTWNHEEVIVPNAELISHAFTNWTHSDWIKRTTLFIGISYDSDPNQVHELLTQIVHDTPGILTEPKPQITLWEFADSAINFRIDYFINLSEAGIFGTRGQVLFTIWNQFHKAGIKIPYPQRDIYIKSMSTPHPQKAL